MEVKELFKEVDIEVTSPSPHLFWDIIVNRTVFKNRSQVTGVKSPFKIRLINTEKDPIQVNLNIKGTLRRSNNLIGFLPKILLFCLFVFLVVFFLMFNKVAKVLERLFQGSQKAEPEILSTTQSEEIRFTVEQNKGFVDLQFMKEKHKQNDEINRMKDYIKKMQAKPQAQEGNRGSTN